MKTKILLLMILSGLILNCCKSKHKITAVSKENKQETEKVQVDSLGLQSSESAQSASAGISFREKINEVSGDILIRGKTEIFNPFVFHNVLGNDTIQSISIMGNAEYSISNHYTKTDNKKSEVRKEKRTDISQDLTHSAVLKEKTKESASSVSKEEKTVKTAGFQAGTWIVITAVAVFLIFIFFTYKYFKK